MKLKHILGIAFATLCAVNLATVQYLLFFNPNSDSMFGFVFMGMVMGWFSFMAFIFPH